MENYNFFCFSVVIRLGSIATFSNTLIDLQEEIKPLWKLQSCPRDFKRTTVERIFRDEGFILDWCNFKLVNNIYHPKTNSVINGWKNKKFYFFFTHADT